MNKYGKDFENAENLWKEHIESSMGKKVVLELVSLDGELEVNVLIKYDGFICGMSVALPEKPFEVLKSYSKEYIINYLAQFELR